MRDAADRRDRLARQLADIDREATDIAARIGGLADPAEKRVLVEQATLALDSAEAQAVLAEKAVAEARQREAALRSPVQEALAELARIETEARTLAKILNSASGGLFPAVLEQIKVERGFETALGAALGEDLDIPLDCSAPAHSGEIEPDKDDPALPAGVRPLIAVVHAPRQLARRLQQIGIVETAEGKRFQSALKPGQRLVSREGAVWRWDGFTASADAPTAAAQRLAQKTGSPNSTAMRSPRLYAFVRPRMRYRRPKAVCGRQARTSGSRGRLGATPNTGSARRAMRWRGLRRQLARCRAAGPRSRKRGVVSRRAMPRPKRRS